MLQTLPYDINKHLFTY